MNWLIDNLFQLHNKWITTATLILYLISSHHYLITTAAIDIIYTTAITLHITTDTITTTNSIIRLSNLILVHVKS